MWYNIIMNFFKNLWKNNLRDFCAPTENNGGLPVILGNFFMVILITIFLVTRFGLGLGFSALIRLDYFTGLSRQRIVERVNQSRQDAKLNLLAYNETLSNAASEKLEDMYANNYFSHVSPQNIDPWHWFDAAGYDYAFAGENLAMDFSDSDSLMDAWLSSLPHRENILNPRFEDIGIAIGSGTLNGKETILVAQLFGAKNKKIASAPPNRSPIVNEPINKNKQNEDIAVQKAIPAQALFPAEPQSTPQKETPGPWKNSLNAKNAPRFLPLNVDYSAIAARAFTVLNLLRLFTGYAQNSINYAVALIAVIAIIGMLLFSVKQKTTPFALTRIGLLILIVALYFVFPITHQSASLIIR